MLCVLLLYEERVCERFLIFCFCFVCVDATGVPNGLTKVRVRRMCVDFCVSQVVVGFWCVCVIGVWRFFFSLSVS